MPAPTSIKLRDKYDVLMANTVSSLRSRWTAADNGEVYRILGCTESRASSRMQSYNETEAL